MQCMLNAILQTIVGVYRTDLKILEVQAYSVVYAVYIYDCFYIHAKPQFARLHHTSMLYI